MSGIKFFGKKERRPCGCLVDDKQIIEWCEKDRAEWQAIHERWAADHQARLLAGTFPVPA